MKNKLFLGLFSLLFFVIIIGFISRWEYLVKGPKIKGSGEELYRMHACNTCHSLDGSRMIGPTFKGLYGKVVELNGGTSQTADEQYLRESILDPPKKIVKNFPNLMGSYHLLLNEEEVNKIIDFIKRQ